MPPSETDADRLASSAEAPDGSNGRPDLAGLRCDVEARLRHELGPEMYYHDAAHTLEDVVPATLALAAGEGIDGVARDRLHAAALLHDIGYTRSTVEHERVGAEMAREILPRFGFQSEDVEAVARLILATRLGHEPTGLDEAVITDADLDVLGRPDFWQRHLALQRELAALGLPHDDVDWVAIQRRFLNAHRFRTTTALALRSEGKRANVRRVARRLRRLERLAERGRRPGPRR